MQPSVITAVGDYYGRANGVLASEDELSAWQVRADRVGGFPSKLPCATQIEYRKKIPCVLMQMRDPCPGSFDNQSINQLIKQ